MILSGSVLPGQCGRVRMDYGARNTTVLANRTSPRVESIPAVHGAALASAV